MNNEKILIFHHSNVIGGAGISLIDILLSINKNLYDITVYIPRGKKDLYDEIKKLNITIKFFQFEIPIIEHFSGLFHFILSPRSIINIFSILRSRINILNIIKIENPSILILNSMTLSYIGYFLKNIKIKKICFHRETFIKGFLGFRTTIIKYFLSNYFNVLVFISKFDFQKVSTLKTEKYLIYDKVHLDKFTGNFKTSNKDFIILFTGGMQRIKGALVILRALTILPKTIKLLFIQYDLNLSDFSKIPLLISFKERIKYLFSIGYNYKIFKFIKRKNLSSRIILLGSQSNMSKFFNQSDVVVFPSTSPHQARPLYEAGAAKKPILITKSENIKEFFINGQNGYWFNNKDYKTLAKQILILSTDSKLRYKLGENNYSLTLKNHDFRTLSYEMSKILGSYKIDKDL